MTIRIKAKELNAKHKRINLSVCVNDYCKLSDLCQVKGIKNLGTLALSMLCQQIRIEHSKINKDILNQLNGFDQKRIK